MCKQYVSRRAFFSRGFLLGKIIVLFAIRLE